MSECDLTGTQSRCRYSKEEVTGEGPNPVWLGSTQKGQIWTQRQGERKDHVNMKVKTVGDTLTSRAMPETPAKHQELGERHGRASWPSEGSRPANMWTSHLQNCETLNGCCLHHSICAVLCGQSEPTDTEYMPEWLLRSLIITKSHQVTACLWSLLRKDANESQLFRDA